MSVILKISENPVKEIKLVHIFKENNAIYITSDENVFSFGTNDYGRCGLGHCEPVEIPTLIPELCGKQIKYFSIGLTFALALNEENNVFSWGKNHMGELARGFSSKDTNDILKPQIILKLRNVIEISCGFGHSLALDNQGIIYGWGNNKQGQIDCDRMHQIYAEPTKIEICEAMKSVYCFEDKSFALATNGSVYSWGENKSYFLGNESRATMFDPYLISFKEVIENITYILSLNIISVRCSRHDLVYGNTYFLTEQNDIYFCGYIGNEKITSKSTQKSIPYNDWDFVKSPIKLKTELKFEKIAAIDGKVLALSRNNVYEMDRKELKITEYDQFSDFFLNVKRTTHETIEFAQFRLLRPFEDAKLLNLFMFIPKNREFRFKIRIFHVFCDLNGYNYLFVTKDDEVFAFGSNDYGKCGLGHKEPVDSEIEIQELSGQRIKQFIVASDFVLALTQENQVFGWGNNNKGQLGTGMINGTLLKPQQIKPLKRITSISCGLHHSLALDSEGKVFGWGNNQYGQVGCANERQETEILTPIQVIINGCYSGKSKIDLISFSIKSIYCAFHQSFAITSNGRVYSWGENSNSKLGHSGTNNFNRPKEIIGLSNVVAICSTRFASYFLTTSGSIYFCGRIDKNSDRLQISPQLIYSSLKFESICSIDQSARGRSLINSKYSDSNADILVLCKETIYNLARDTFKKTEYKSFFDYFSNNFRTTHKSIDFYEKYEKLAVLGNGTYATVFKVRYKNGKKLYALKVSTILNESTEKYEQQKAEFNKEVEILKKCSGQFVVKYFDSWVDKEQYFILMELCSSNLKIILEEKSNCFGKNSPDSMDITEFFISLEILKELLKCLKYLHESDPPIIHRDLKPANILINIVPINGKFIKICDFGLATFGGEKSSHTTWKGTPKYMAPEILRGSTKYNTTADIYSVAMIICDLVNYDLSSSNVNLKNNELKRNWTDLDNLYREMTKEKFNERPSASDILLNYDLWKFDEQLQKINFDLVSGHQNKFFLNYLESKIDRKLTNNYCKKQKISK